MQASGVILSGGKSSRMTFNKSFADMGGETLLDISMKKFVQNFDEVLIITNDPDSYANFKAKVYTDIYPGLGPIAGIHSALYYAEYKPLFLMACDMPFMDMKLAHYMLGQAGGYDSVVPVIKGKLQPLVAVYNDSCMKILTQCLEQQKLKLTRVFEELHTRYICEDELQQFGDIHRLFFNVNDPGALERARQMAGG